MGKKSSAGELSQGEGKEPAVTPQMICTDSKQI